MASPKVDMLNGSLTDKIIFFAVPLALAAIAQQLFTAVDVAIVGLYAGTEAQAAVGCNGSFVNLMLNLFIGISIGANVVIAHFIGQRDDNNAKRATETAISVAIGSGIVLLILGQIIARPVLILLGTPLEVIDLAVRYLRIFLFGVPFLMIFNFGASVLRSIGDTKRPLYCLIISGIINATLNVVLIVGFGRGVEGVAIATVIANIFNAGFILRLLKRETGAIHLEKVRLTFPWQILKKMLAIGLPAGLQGMTFSFANVCIQSAVNSHGAHAVAGSAVASNYEFFTYFVLASFTQATVTFTSQNYAAGNLDRCRKIFRIALPLAAIFTGIVSMSVVYFDDFCAGLFTNDPLALGFAKIRIHHILFFNFIAASYEISSAAMRGMGYSMTPAVITIFGTCLLRLIWVFAVCPIYTSFETLMDIYPITWVITGILVLSTYFYIFHKVRVKHAIL